MERPSSPSFPSPLMGEGVMKHLSPTHAHEGEREMERPSPPGGGRGRRGGHPFPSGRGRPPLFSHRLLGPPGPRGRSVPGEEGPRLGAAVHDP
jgi:hypothetical protein